MKLNIIARSVIKPSFRNDTTLSSKSAFSGVLLVQEESATIRAFSSLQ